MNDWNWFVYILECNNGLYYTGVTWNLSHRVEQHYSRSVNGFTAKHGVKALVYAEQHDDFRSALQRERQIKKWSRTKKEKLISGEWSHY